jgi:peroxiredoxin
MFNMPHAMRKFRFRGAIGALLVAMLGYSISGTAAENAPAREATAIETLYGLYDEAEAAMAEAGERIDEVRSEWADRLKAFAEAHSGTDAAAESLMGAATLLTGNEQILEARETLKQALAHTENADLRVEIAEQLGRLTVVNGEPAPDFEAETMAGEAISLEDFRGKVVLLDFWATWCAPCIAELPTLRSAYETYHDRGFEIVSVSMDAKEEMEHLKAVIETNELVWHHVFNGSMEESKSLAHRYGVRPLPRLVLIGADGRVVSGYLHAQEIDEKVQAALAAGSEGVDAPGDGG